MIDHLKKVASACFRRENFRPILIFLAVVFFLWFAIFGDHGLYHLHKSVKMRNKLKEEIVQLQNRIQTLKKNKELLNNPSHLEIIIRQELGYVKKDEVIFQQMSP
ncbi:MAG: septum formation initiator family protein [Deltaproteobacteria bacterium]|nr:septum formation initiator family protein [Deltaproteobacteria bacterium]MBI2974899.1 septum formation initiator family protein [Deltaproteobacteria bacterium]